MRWAAGIIFYQDRRSLKRTLDCVTPHFDHVFCIDGRWRNYPTPNDLSTDGSRELVKEYQNTILYDAGGLKQPEKRQKYFDLARQYECELLLIIDSDEWFEGDVEQWKQAIEEQCASIPMAHLIDVWFRVTKGEPHQYAWLPKLCWQPRYFTYQFTHYTYYHRETGLTIPSTNGNKHVTFMHDDRLRDSEWTARQTMHDLWQIIYELQLKYRASPHMRQHIQKYGYDAVERLLQDNPDLAAIVHNFKLQQVQPDGSYFANPEYKEFGQAVRRWMRGP